MMEHPAWLVHQQIKNGIGRQNRTLMPVDWTAEKTIRLSPKQNTWQRHMTESKKAKEKDGRKVSGENKSKREGGYRETVTAREKERESRVRGWRHADRTAARSQWDLPSSDRCKASQWDQTLPAGRLSAPSSWKSMKITSKPSVRAFTSACAFAHGCRLFTRRHQTSDATPACLVSVYIPFTSCLIFSLFALCLDAYNISIWWSNDVYV